MNKYNKVSLLLCLLVFLFSKMSWSFEVTLLTDGSGVEICKNENADGTYNVDDCITLDHDVDDLSNIGFGDEISTISIGPYTSVVLFEHANFDEDGSFLVIPPSSYGLNLDQEDLEDIEALSGDLEDYGWLGAALGLPVDGATNLFEQISSIRVHPREFVECDPGDVDDCLMEAAKPILIYDEGTSDEYNAYCNDRFHDGEAGFRSGVQTTEDDQYKIVFYQIWHKQDCGVSVVDILGLDLLDDILEEFGVDLTTDLDAHAEDGEVAKFAFQKIVDGEDTYWALVASRYQHHECTTARDTSNLSWPLRIYISEGKHAQYTSEWECNDWDYIEAIICSLEGGDMELDVNDADEMSIEDCDSWVLSENLEQSEEGSEGGEVLYRDEYSLVEDSFSEDSTDWFDTINISLDEAGLVVIQPADVVEETAEEVDCDIYTCLTINSAESYSSTGDLTLEEIVEQSGYTYTEGSSYAITVASDADDDYVTLSASCRGGYDVILTPYFHVERGAELWVIPQEGPCSQ